VIPEAVSMTSAGYLEVNNDPVLWTMLNAIKDLKKQKDRELASRDEQIAALKLELASQRSELASVKSTHADRMASLEGKLEMLVRAQVAGKMALLGAAVIK